MPTHIVKKELKVSASSGRRPHPGRRTVAACGYDYLFCFGIALAIMHVFEAIAHIPARDSVALRLLTLTLFLSRDFWNGGRGFGKYFLGLRTVDATTGATPTLRQSILRNLVLVGPYYILEITALVASRSHLPAASSAAINIAATILAGIFLAVEIFCIYSRGGIRTADRVANTKVTAVEWSDPVKVDA